MPLTNSFSSRARISRPILYLLILPFILIYPISIFLSEKHKEWSIVKDMLPGVSVLILVVNLSPTLKRRWQSLLAMLNLHSNIDFQVDNPSHKHDLKINLLNVSYEKCKALIADIQQIFEDNKFHAIEIGLTEFNSFRSFVGDRPLATPQITLASQTPSTGPGLFRYALIGEPGHGKTYTLLKWMENSLEQKQIQIRDPASTDKIPVYIRLDTWSFQQDFSAFIIFALQNSYGMNLPEASWFVRNMLIIPYLDGLDEVEPAYRSECFEAILHYARSNSVLFTCRKTAMDELLAVQTGKYDDPIHIFLMRDLQKERVLEVIRNNTNEKEGQPSNLNPNVLSYLTTPLMLSLFVNTYTHQKKELPAAIDENQLLESLWKTYINTNLGSASSIDTGSPDAMSRPITRNRKNEQGMSYLLSMSNYMTGNTFFLDNIQPDWLPAGTPRFLYYLISRLATGAILSFAIGFITTTPGKLIANGLLASLLVTLLTFFVNKKKGEMSLSQVKTITLYCIVLAVFCGLYEGLIIPQERSHPWWTRWFSPANSLAGILLGIIFGVIFGYRQSTQSVDNDIQPLHIFKFDIRASQLISLRASLYMGLAVGAASGWLRYFIKSSNFLRSIANITNPARKFLVQYCPYFPLRVDDWLIFFSFGFGAAFIGTFILFLIMGARDRQKSYLADSHRLTSKFALNYGIRRSTIIALKSGFMGFLIFLLIYGMVMALTWGLSQSARSIMMGIGVGLISFLWYGGFEVIQHWTLRVLLYLYGIFPFRFRYWLTLLTNKDLLMKEGSAIHFRHETLLTYFQSIPPNDSQRSIKYDHPILRRIVFFAVFAITIYRLYLPFQRRYIEDYYWTSPIKAHFNTGNLVNRTPDSGIFISPIKQTITLTVKGLIETGLYTGYIDPEETRVGFLGFPLNDSSVYNKLPKLPHGAFLCRVSSFRQGSWFAPFKRTRRLYYSSRKNTIALNAGDTLAFEINDKEYQNNSGAFTVSITK